MPEWLAVALLTLAGLTLTATGAVVGHLLSAKAQKRAAEVQSEATQITAQDKLIDQLQEELTTSRAEQSARMLALESRTTALEERNGVLVEMNDRYRDLLHKHRAHIWNGESPPPPEWPEDLPR